MFKLLKRFVREESGQDFAVLARYRNELQAASEAGIEALRMARGG